MSERASAAGGDPVPWILEGDAAQRYVALTRLLGAAPDAP
jgi:hypothetical protein